MSDKIKRYEIDEDVYVTENERHVYNLFIENGYLVYPLPKGVGMWMVSNEGTKILRMLMEYARNDVRIPILNALGLDSLTERVDDVENKMSDAESNIRYIENKLE